MRTQVPLFLASQLILAACVTPTTPPQQSGMVDKKVASYGAWDVFCNPGNSICETSMIITNFATDAPKSKTKVFAGIRVVLLPKHKEAVAGITIVLPPSTSTVTRVLFSVDNKITKSYPIQYCQKANCVANLGLTRADLRLLNGGQSVKLTIVDSRAPNTPYYIFFPLTGLSNALADAQNRSS